MNRLKECDCGGQLIVRDSREKADGVWRRRECNKCLKVTYTMERYCPEPEHGRKPKKKRGVKLYGKEEV